MTQDLNYDLFRVPKWPGKLEDWCDTSEKMLRKWPKTGIFCNFGAQSGPKIGPLRTIFSTQYLQWTRWTLEAKLMWNQWKHFEKVTKYQTFDLIWGPKRPRNWAFEAHNFHISASSFNGHIKQDWCESRGSFYFLWDTYRSSSNELVNEISRESSRKFPRK